MFLVFTLAVLTIFNFSLFADANDKSENASFSEFFFNNTKIVIPPDVVERYGRVPIGKSMYPTPKIKNGKLGLDPNDRNDTSSADPTANFIIQNEGFAIDETEGDIYFPMLSVPLFGQKGCGNNKKGIFRLSFDGYSHLNIVKTIEPSTYAGMEARIITFGQDDDFLVLSHSPSSLLHAVIRLASNSNQQVILPFAAEVIDKSCQEAEQFYIKTFFESPRGDVIFGIWNHLKKSWQLVSFANQTAQYEYGLGDLIDKIRKKPGKIKKIKDICEMYNTYPCNIFNAAVFDSFVNAGGYSHYTKKSFSKDLNTYLLSGLQKEYPEKLDQLSPDMFFVQGPNGNIYVQSQINPVIEVYDPGDGQIVDHIYDSDDRDLTCLFGDYSKEERLRCSKNLERRLTDMMAKPSASLPRYDGLAVNDSGYVIRTTVFNKDDVLEHRTVEIFDPKGGLEAKDIPLEKNSILLLNTGPVSHYFYFLKVESHYQDPINFIENLSLSVRSLRQGSKNLDASNPNTVFLNQFLDFLDSTIGKTNKSLAKYSSDHLKKNYISIRHLDDLSKYITRNNMRLSNLFMNLPFEADFQSQISDLRTSLEKLTEIRRESYEISQWEPNI